MKYDIYDIVNETIEIKKMEEILNQLSLLCDDNIDVVSNNYLWKANSKTKYCLYIENIKKCSDALKMDISKLKDSADIVEKIKKLDNQIQELKDKIEKNKLKPELSSINLEEQLNNLLEERNKIEKDLFDRWSL